MNVSSFVLCLNEINGFLLTDSTAVMGMLFKNEIREWFTNDQTHLGGLAWMLPGMTTGAFVQYNIGRRFEQEIPRLRKRNDLFQVPAGNGLVYSNDCPGIFPSEDLEVKTVSPPFLSLLS